MTFRLLPALALVLLASCKDPPTSIYDIVNVAHATVILSVDTVVATRNVLPAQESFVFGFPLSVTNTGTDALRIFSCLSGLEAKIEGQWMSSGGGRLFPGVRAGWRWHTTGPDSRDERRRP